ncbi:MAG: hypothetical protein LUD50_05770 [Clostridia bacterium]|nr:hypothetical protein [Clostridia bacterium]
MYNTEGFDKLYKHIMKEFPNVPEDSILKDIFWISFSDLTPASRPTPAELERRLERFGEPGADYLDGVKVMSALCGVPVYKLVNEEGQSAVCQLKIQGTKTLAFPIFTDPERVKSTDFPMGGLKIAPTSIFHVVNYMEENEDIEGIILNPGTADFAIKTKDIEDFFVNFSSTFGFFEDCLEEGVQEDYLFPMLFSWFDDRNVEIFFKDSTFCAGHVTEVIYGDLGDATALHVQTDDGTATTAGIDEISSIRALPIDHDNAEDQAIQESLSSLKEAICGPEDESEPEPEAPDDTDPTELN